MKKSFVALFACLSLAAGAYAQDAAEAQPAQQQQPAQLQRVETRTIEPVWFALQGNETIDVVGIRLSAWGKANDITGLDLSICGDAVNAYGLQIALGSNEVIDRAGALQIAIGANYAGSLSGMQIGLLNESVAAKGFQIGLLNASDDVRGLQIGLLNTTNSIYGFQIGVINIIKSSPVTFFPILNTVLGY